MHTELLDVARQADDMLEAVAISPSAEAAELTCLSKNARSFVELISKALGATRFAVCIAGTAHNARRTFCLFL